MIPCTNNTSQTTAESDCDSTLQDHSLKMWSARGSTGMPVPPSTDAFKNAMRRFASSVTIVTAANGGTRFGITVTAVTSVTMQPPTILACINRNTSIHKIMQCGSYFCINVLRSLQGDLMRAFSGSVAADERFLHGDWSTDQNGTPFLRDAQVNVFCSVVVAMGYGSHTIFLGNVDSVAVQGEFEPMIYADGRMMS